MHRSNAARRGSSYTVTVDLNWLESFLGLLEHGSFTKAAQAQHLSQPAFSRRIRALEHWIGTELVDRSTFPIALTPAGVQFHAEACQTVSGLAAVRDLVRGRQCMPREAVTVALSHTLATAYFDYWWQRVKPPDGTVPCRLLPYNTLEAYEALHHGGCDLLLAYVEPAHPTGVDTDEIEWIPVAPDRLSPYSALSEGAPKYPLPPPPGRQTPFLSHGSGAFLGRLTERAQSSADELALQSAIQCDLTESLAKLVTAGVGVAWLPGLLAQPAVDRGLMVQVGDGRWGVDLEVRLYRRRNARPSAPVAKIWNRAMQLANSDKPEPPSPGGGSVLVPKTTTAPREMLDDKGTYSSPGHQSTADEDRAHSGQIGGQ